MHIHGDFQGIACNNLIFQRYMVDNPPGLQMFTSTARQGLITPLVFQAVAVRSG
jgi:hypothetical protein